MTRDEIIAKWDGMTSRERDDWVARDVMGWRRVSRPGAGGGYIGWEDADGRIVAIESDCTLSSGPQDWFRPSEDIRWAWAVLTHNGVYGEVSYMGDMCRAEVWARWNPETGVGEHEYAVSESETEAICLATIIAALKSDGGSTKLTKGV